MTFIIPKRNLGRFFFFRMGGNVTDGLPYIFLNSLSVVQPIGVQLNLSCFELAGTRGVHASG